MHLLVDYCEFVIQNAQHKVCGISCCDQLFKNMERASCVWLKDEAQKGLSHGGEGEYHAVLQLLYRVWGQG